MNTLITDTTLRVSKGVQLQQRSDGYKKKIQKSEEILMIDNSNNIHAFNYFEEENHVDRYKCHFRRIDLMRDNSYDMGVPGIEK